MKGAKHKTKLLDNNVFVGYSFIAPWLIGFLGLSVIPMITSFYLSFTKYNMVSSPVWTGFNNYIKMFTDDERYINSILVTLYYVFVSVPLKISFALLVAILLNQKFKVFNFYRSIYYLPSMIGGSVAVSMMWKELFATDGAINAFLSLLRLPSETRWLGMPETAVFVLVTLTVWQFGSSMIIFTAGLKQIPETYYEAAEIDGASGLGKFFYITLPVLSPVIFFNLVMQTIAGFMTFTQAFVITRGGPLDSTNFYALYVYHKAFIYNEMGYGSAMSWILLVIIAAVTALIFKTSQMWVFYESKD